MVNLSRMAPGAWLSDRIREIGVFGVLARP
jgi:hypothetical protein